MRPRVKAIRKKEAVKRVREVRRVATPVSAPEGRRRTKRRETGL